MNPLAIFFTLFAAALAIPATPASKFTLVPNPHITFLPCILNGTPCSTGPCKQPPSHPQIRAKWLAMGGRTGALGCSYDSEDRVTPEGRWRKFEKGFVPHPPPLRMRSRQ